MAVPSLAATAPAPVTLSTSAVASLPAWGTYAVLVSMAKATVQQTANVYVGSQSQHGLTVAPWTGAEAMFYVHVKAKKLTVLVTGSAAPVKFTVHVSRQPSTAVPAASANYSDAPKDRYNKLVWSASFAGAPGTPPNPADWIVDTSGGCGSGTLSTNTSAPANVSLDGRGNLAITALRDPSQRGGYSSAQIDTQGVFSFTYGRLEARMKLPTGAGLCSAFWMVGDSAVTSSCWPACGEIDVMEQIGQDPALISGTLHGPFTNPPAGDTNDQQWQAGISSATPLAGSWHTYGLIWSPGRISFTVDGLPYGTATRSTLPKSASWVFDGHPFHIILDLAVGGWPGPPAADTKFPATLRIAWVHVYQ